MLPFVGRGSSLRRQQQAGGGMLFLAVTDCRWWQNDFDPHLSNTSRSAASQLRR